MTAKELFCWALSRESLVCCIRAGSAITEPAANKKEKVCLCYAHLALDGSVLACVSMSEFLMLEGAVAVSKGQQAGQVRHNEAPEGTEQHRRSVLPPGRGVLSRPLVCDTDTSQPFATLMRCCGLSINSN